MDRIRAYVDRRVVDLEGATAAAVEASRRWELAPPILMRSGMNAIFRCGDLVLRVSTPSASADLSLRLASMLRRQQIPVVRAARSDVIESGPFSVTAWWYVEPTGEPIDWVAVGEVVARVHRLRRQQVPFGIPLPTPIGFPWWEFDAMFDAVDGLVDAPAMSGMRDALARHEGWDFFDDTVICHGDVHPGNVIMGEWGMTLIDWDLLCLAPPGWDHAPMMTWTSRWGGQPEVYEDFAEGYGWSARHDARAEAFAELRLVAATLMRVKAGRRDEAARSEAERRLMYWRGDPDAPAWRAQ